MLNKRVAVFDLETDPFLYGRNPEPFAAGFFNGHEYAQFWGEYSLDQFIDYCERDLKEPHVIYAHNGGKFDFFYLLKAGVLENPIKIINGRIVKAKFGRHEIRDSFAIMPIPLAAYQKDEIDYNWFEVENREHHKKEILSYLESDCLYLYDLVTQFINRFGMQLTIGGTAIKKLQEMHPFEQTNQAHDERFRQFYFGGRVQFFESGMINQKVKVIDVNSMYPHVMHAYKHPVGTNSYCSYYSHATASKMLNAAGQTKKNMPYFIAFVGTNRGALPVRTKDGLTFEQQHGLFYTTGHELQVALKHKLVDIEEIKELHIFDECIQFKKYVNTFMKEKIEAKKRKDKAGEIFAKLFLNSAYGKTAQKGDGFYDYYIYYLGEPFDLDLDDEAWELYSDYGDFEIWRKPSTRPVFYDVAIGASITGAARAVLLDALCQVDTPYYCDTDSIICKHTGNLSLDPHALGEWDIEATGNKLAIAGKKIYVLFNNGECVKKACKGAKLEPSDIVAMAHGELIEWKSAAPNFKMDGSTKYTRRTLQKRA